MQIRAIAMGVVTMDLYCEDLALLANAPRARGAESKGLKLRPCLNIVPRARGERV